MKIQQFDFNIDLLQAILWQYNEAVNLQSIITQKQDWYNKNQSEFWEDWYDNVFNLVTADFFGLAVWSIILDVPLFIPINPEPSDKPIWGFNQTISFPTLLNTNENFERGNFSASNSIIILNLEEQRLVLRLKYYKLVSRGAIPEINLFLNELFQTSGTVFSGRAWVLDGFDMTITYVFDFYIPKNMRTVLKLYDLLPRPAGVGIKYLILTGTTFGFGEFNQNFENGNFILEDF